MSHPARPTRHSAIGVSKRKFHPDLQARSVVEHGDGRPGASVTVSVAGATAQTDAIVGRDGRWVVSGSKDGTVRVWEAATAREVRRYSGSKDG